MLYMEKIVKLTVNSNALNTYINFGSLNNVEQYKKAYICIEKFIAAHTGLDNDGLNLSIRDIKECYSKRPADSFISPSSIIDSYVGVPSPDNTARLYNTTNGIETWLEIPMNVLLNNLNIIVSPFADVVLADIYYTLSMKVKLTN